MTSSERLDKITRKISAFDSFQSLLDALGNYRPSLRCNPARGQKMTKFADERELADAYDAAQAARGDNRRVYRY